MAEGSLLNEDWGVLVERLGGAASLEAGARETGAFLRARKVRSAVDLLRLTLAYCLGAMGLRLTVAWGSAMGLGDLSNVALLGRLRNMEGWLTRLVGETLSAMEPQVAAGRLIRVVDAITVPQAGKRDRGRQKLWRVHGALDLSAERFGFVELTDECGGALLDRAPVVAGEIRIGDRAYAQPERMAAVIAGGGDVLVRTGWKNLRWLTEAARPEAGTPLNLLAILRASEAAGVVDRPVLIGRRGKAPPLRMRLVAFAKPPPPKGHGKRPAKRPAPADIGSAGRRLRRPAGSSWSPRSTGPASPLMRSVLCTGCDGASNSPSSA